MSHVFISYMRENSEVVDRLAAELEAHGVTVWLDRQRLRPGQRWRAAIRNAIRDGMLFVACFSPAYEARAKSFMNEELTLAIEELRQRPSDRTWFLPVLLHGGRVPDRQISGAETLRDIQWADLDDWEAGVRQVLDAVLSVMPKNYARTVAAEPSPKGPFTRAGAFSQILIEHRMNPFPKVRDFVFDELEACVRRHESRGVMPRVCVAEAIAAAEDHFGEHEYSWPEVQRVIEHLIQSHSILLDDEPMFGRGVLYAGRSLVSSLAANWRLTLESQFLASLVAVGFRMTITDVPALAEALYGDASAVGCERVEALLRHAVAAQVIRIATDESHSIISRWAG